MTALFYQPEIPGTEGELDAEESRHCFKVLRKKEGDLISLTDGKGNLYQASLTKVHPTTSSFNIISKEFIPKPTYRIHLGVSPTKNPDRFEWMIEKCTELGVDEITPLICKNSERLSVNMERLDRICVSAMKQALRVWKPLINPLQTFSDFISRLPENNQLFIAYVDQGNPVHLMQRAHQGQDYLLMIGPEGDFSKDELDTALTNGFAKVSLGKFRLRTETAAIAGCHILNLLNQA